DETVAACGTQAGLVRLLRVPGGQPLAELEGHGDSVEAVAFSGDGSLLVSGSADGSVRLWRLQGEEFRRFLALPVPGPVKALALSRDGSTLAVLVRGELGVRLWHLDRLRDGLAACGL